MDPTPPHLCVVTQEDTPEDTTQSQMQPIQRMVHGILSKDLDRNHIKVFALLTLVTSAILMII